MPKGKSLVQLEKQIDALKRQADDLRKREAAGVAARIREAIEAYGFTADELGFGAAGAKSSSSSSSSSPAAAPRTVARKSNGTSSKAKPAVRFRDEAGNTWIGRGPRPAWFKEALAAGKKASDFAV